jgi:hypothetical protein
MNSPAFSDFRDLLNRWDETKDVLKIKSLLQDNGFVMFFKKDGSIFGAPEISRVTFAKMKNPDEDSEWADEANFAAFDLLKALTGERMQGMFGKKDIDSLELIDQDQVEKLLSKNPSKKIVIDLNPDRDDVEPEPEDLPTIAKIGETWRPVPNKGG